MRWFDGLRRQANPSAIAFVLLMGDTGAVQVAVQTTGGQQNLLLFFLWDTAVSKVAQAIRFYSPYALAPIMSK